MAEIVPGAEFHALPIEFIIAAPLSGAVKAQAVVAQNIKGFLELYKADSVEFKTKVQAAAGTTEATINVPLLSIVPVPHLRIDSLTVDFKYEISQVIDEKQ